jgi:hypothetical protein
MKQGNSRVVFAIIAIAASFGFFIGGDCGTSTPAKDTTPPSVSSVSPTNGATNIEISVIISAVFSEAIDSATLTITLKEGGSSVSGTVGYDSSAKKGTLTPASALKYSTTYTVTVAAGLKDTKGNAMASDYTWTFKTKAIALPSLPLTAGQRWFYTAKTSDSVWVGWNPPSVEEFEGSWAVYYLDGTGRKGGKDCSRLLLARIPDVKGVFSAEIKYILQNSEGLKIWNGNEWLTILSPYSTEFNSNGLLLSKMPSFADSKLSTGSVTVPAGTYNAMIVACQYQTQYSQYNTYDVDEDEFEYYADGVGAVKANWNYSYDDNDPQGGDVAQTGEVTLKNVNTGPIPTLSLETEPNDNWTTVNPFAVLANVVFGNTKDDDTGQVINDANVDSTKRGTQTIHDWYAFTLTSNQTVNIALTFAVSNDDLDLYLFQKASSSSLTFKAKSTMEPGNDELISLRLLAGTYYIGIQAWDTTGGRTDYYLNIR